MGASKQMKQLFPTSLALLLVMGSLGHVFAAAFCPRMAGHPCCLTKTASGQPGPQSHEHMQGMAMDTMSSETMQMDGSDTSDMTMEDPAFPPSSIDNEANQLSRSDELVSSTRIKEPVDACTHCMSHSGMQNAPVSSVGVPNQSNKGIGSVPLTVPRFLTRPAMTLTQIGPPRQHAPSGSSATRHILINVFLI